MSIQMIGIDHTRAGIDVRTVFSFTKKKMAEALEKVGGKGSVSYTHLTLPTILRV